MQVVLLAYYLMCKLPKPDTVLLQTPPAVPTLALCSFACWWYGALLVVDWHNFGYSIMAITMGYSSLLVRTACWYERTFGRQAHRHLCVSKAMQQFLLTEWGIPAKVVYDRPPAWFHKASLHQKHDLFEQLVHCVAQGQAQAQNSFHANRLQPLPDVQDAEALKWLKDGKPFTELVNGRPCLRPDRPALLVSSTSWTVDEDFGVLLEAGILYDAEARAAGGKLPNLMVIVTGKGPQKAMYERRMQQLGLQHVAFRTAWLAAADYPVLLGSADLGVSLHTSSSGLDLPMKIVDMFGCGLPVCAARYSCIGELVKEHDTGLLFSSPQELALQLVDLLQGFPRQPSRQLQQMQQQVQQTLGNWADNWESITYIFQ